MNNLYISAFQTWKPQNQGYPQSDAPLCKGVCQNATPLVFISWVGEFSESIKKDFSNTLGIILRVHIKEFREQYAQARGNRNLNADSWVSDTSYYHSGNNRCHYDNTPNATPACGNNLLNHNGYEKRNTKCNGNNTARLHPKITARLLLQNLKKPEIRNQSDNLCHPVTRWLLYGMGLLRYISDAPAKSGVRFGTLKNKDDTVRHYLIACFFCVGNLLARLLKSSRVFMVGCIGVAIFVLRTKPVQPATLSMNASSGQDFNHYNGVTFHV